MMGQSMKQKKQPRLRNRTFSGVNAGKQRMMQVILSGMCWVLLTLCQES